MTKQENILWTLYSEISCIGTISATKAINTESGQTLQAGTPFRLISATIA